MGSAEMTSHERLKESAGAVVSLYYLKRYKIRKLPMLVPVRLPHLAEKCLEKAIVKLGTRLA